MSASRPASVMLRAAIATSGGTEAPDVTYCSIWPWTEAISASTSRVLECASSITSTRASRCGSTCRRSRSRMRFCPCTIARIVPSCRRMTCAIFARVPMPYSSSTLLTSSVSELRCVTRATGELARTARSSALTLRSRPTCSGTIISGKITVSRSATIGSTWILSTSRASTWVSPSCALTSGVSTSRVSSSLTGSGATSLWLSDSIWLYVPSVEVAHRIRFVAIDVALDISFIEQVEDADLAERLELEDDLDARQVDPLASGEEADDTHPPDVRLRVEAEVVPALRTEESLLLVDAQRPWMHARQLGGDADEIARSLEITADAHAVTGSLKGRIG